MQLTLGLSALNFAMAGAREGFGPFLGVFLQSEGFNPASTGLAMSLAGIAGVLATAPLGALVDRITAKRSAIVIAVLSIAAGAGLIVLTRSLWLVAVGQVIIGVADTSLAPLVSAMTLGVVGRERYPTQVARNETFNHGGNALNAALSAALGYWLANQRRALVKWGGGGRARTPEKSTRRRAGGAFGGPRPPGARCSTAGPCWSWAWPPSCTRPRAAPSCRSWPNRSSRRGTTPA